MNLVENRYSNCLFIEKEESNLILIGTSSPLQVGTYSGSVVGLDEITFDTTGAGFSGIEAGEAIQFLYGDGEIEIRRVLSVTGSSSIKLTKPLLYTNTTITSYRRVYQNVSNTLTIDTFNNSLTEYNLNYLIYACTGFSSDGDFVDSIFLYDDRDINERYESLITGTYNSFTGTGRTNVSKPFVIDGNRNLSYIINMYKYIGELDVDNEVTITGLEDNIYRIMVNGITLDATQYTIVTTTITIDDASVLNTYNNTIYVLHYPDQTGLGDYNIELKYKAFDKLIITDTNELDLLYKLNYSEGLTSSPSPIYYEYSSKSYKRNEKVKTGQANKLTFTSKIGVQDTLLNAVKNLRYYVGNENFRIIKYSEDSYRVEYYFGCQAKDGIGMTEGDATNTYNYSIDYRDKAILEWNVDTQEYNWIKGD